MLKRIAIDNYKCFTNFEFRPSNINLILGANGSGKSTLMQLVSDVTALVIDGVEVAKVFPEQTRTRWEQRTLQTVELEVALGLSIYIYKLRVEEARILSESVTLDGKTLFAYDDGEVHLHKNDGRPGTKFPFRGHRTFLSEIEDRAETRELMKMLGYLAGVRLFRLDARNVSSVSEQEERFLHSHGENFASWYRHLTQESPEQIDLLRDDLKAVIPGFRTLKLESTDVRGARRQLMALLEASGSSYTVDFGELSDGQRGLILLYTLLHGMKPSAALMLDEPEAHVGLSEVQPWLVRLDTTFERQGQVFITSHHPEVIDYLAASSAWWFERPDGASTRTPRPLPCDRESGMKASQQIARGF